MLGVEFLSLYDVKWDATLRAGRDRGARCCLVRLKSMQGRSRRVVGSVGCWQVTVRSQREEWVGQQAQAR